MMNEELYYFNEDAQEQLQMMENALLDVAQDGPDTEHIGTIFRAMHTIKGSAGMFGFEDVTAFTHIAEHLMDAVRNGKIELDENLLMLLLQCKDHVAALVQCAVESTPIPSNLIETDKQLQASIHHYLGDSDTRHQTEQTHTNETPETESNLWHLSLRLKEHFFESGMDLLAIIAFFKQLGSLKAVVAILDDLPDLESIDPLKPHIGFEIAFEGDVTRDTIEEVFEFVEDDVSLHIFLTDDTQGWAALFSDHPKLQELMQSDLRFGYEPPSLKAAEIPLTLPIVNQSSEASLPQVESAAPMNSIQSLRVDSSKIDTLMDTISEMVIANAKMAQFITDAYSDGELEDISAQFSKLLEELRNSVMNIRMVPVGDSFVKFRRVVNDVAKKLDKKIDFTIEGGETELDKTVIEKISDPLLHMLRNAIDHGIEMPSKRRENHKPDVGHVELRAYPESGSIVIEIEDDGKGLDAEALIAKARHKNIIGQNDELTQTEAYQLIFAPGFSTAEVISDISGRGVGMDVVKKNIEALKGDVEVHSTLGQGSRFVIRLPLTLAIIDGFLFQVGKTHYIVPLDMVAEVIEYTEKHRVDMLESNLFDLRGALLPLLDIRSYFKEAQCDTCERSNIIVVRYGRQKMGLLVDELYGEFQTVIKPLGKLFKNAPGLYGASILGSGDIALIFDIPALFETLKLNQSAKESA